MSWLYGFLAAGSAVGCEVYYRANVGRSYVSLLLPWGLLLAVLVNFAIYGLLQSENLLGATVVFTLFTASLRLAWTLHLHETVTWPNWLAYALVVLAALVKLTLRPA